MEKLSDDLITDFKVVVADAEALLKATANQGGDKLAEVRAKAEESLRVAKARMADAQAELLVKTSVGDTLTPFDDDTLEANESAEEPQA